MFAVSYEYPHCFLFYGPPRSKKDGWGARKQEMAEIGTNQNQDRFIFPGWCKYRKPYELSDWLTLYRGHLALDGAEKKKSSAKKKSLSQSRF